MTVRWEEIPKWLLIAFAFWFLNFNSSLGRYNDLIHNCRLGRDLVTTQNRDGWVIAEHARHATSMRTHTPEDHRAVLKYHFIHRKLDSYLAKPCTQRYHRPGVFG